MMFGHPYLAAAMVAKAAHQGKSVQLPVDEKAPLDDDRMSGDRAAMTEDQELLFQEFLRRSG